MSKRNNTYKISLQEVELKDGTTSGKSLELEFENHDNLFAVLEKVQSQNLFPAKSDEIEFTIGLKLFSEVMIRNRTNPLFEDFSPAFKEFMQKLKGKK